ncbi:MAG: type I DNA topoisomerase [Chloroflexi bacterium]|nr:type I DNA topoisomerase [Chloroflexota bacterium]
MTTRGRPPRSESTPSASGRRTTKRLVIVESPAKARTVGKFLGHGYIVRASVGHVRDLPEKRLGVDVAHDFQPQYVIPEKKKSVVRQLQQEAKEAQELYLATDPDREGEAISWHLQTALKTDGKPVHRVVFHEITRDAIREAFRHPRAIDLQLVEAQQARRVLDRLVGYSLSPLLRKKVARRNVSAGRVQSVALRLVVEREREIEAFKPEEYWTLDAELAKAPSRARRQAFRAGLVQIRGEKAELRGEAETQAVVDDLAGARYVVADVRQREVQRQPAAPFTTSTLQQEAARKLGFSATRTMRVAQQLYEGLALGREGEVGLITYMRTDSTTMAESAVSELRAYIADKFGRDYLPDAPRTYRARAKGAQEAHEAIRPTSVWREPEAVQPHLTPEQYRLYRLIWQRTVACQMAAARFDQTTAEIDAGRPGAEPPYRFRATGSVLRFQGFIAVYTEGRDDGDEPEEKQKALPLLDAGEELALVQLLPEQHFTQPPPRYTEATLVKALEEHGIGRPSTYAPTLNTLQERTYVRREGKQLRPTELGVVVNDLLVRHFSEVVNVGFTAEMETRLDDIARGEQEWVRVVRSFYEPFAVDVERAAREMERVDLRPEEAGEDCPACGSPMVIRHGRFGKFIACSAFPKCRETKPFRVAIGVPCPECGAELVERTSRRGRAFYGCSRYPDCQFALWQRPLPEPCPACGGIMVQRDKQRAQCTKCRRTGALPEQSEAAS